MVPPVRRTVLPFIDTSMVAVVHAYRPIILAVTCTGTPFQFEMEFVFDMNPGV
jgi:hypothetical protein